jgi:hypothetical protein
MCVTKLWRAPRYYIAFYKDVVYLAEDLLAIIWIDY